MTTIYEDETIWVSDSKEVELHRYRKKNGTQGHAITIEKYKWDEWGEDGNKRGIVEFLELDERYFFLAARSYLQEVGFDVSKRGES